MSYILSYSKLPLSLAKILPQRWWLPKKEGGLSMIVFQAPVVTQKLQYIMLLYYPRTPSGVIILGGTCSNDSESFTTSCLHPLSQTRRRCPRQFHMSLNHITLPLAVSSSLVLFVLLQSTQFFAPITSPSRPTITQYPTRHHYHPDRKSVV